MCGRGAGRGPPLLGSAASRACAGPSELVLELGPHEGHFRQRWNVARRTFVALPGDAKRWPQDVRVDGSRVPAVERGGRVEIELDAGEHEASGVLRWDSLPEMLQIPMETGSPKL